MLLATLGIRLVLLASLAGADPSAPQALLSPDSDAASVAPEDEFGWADPGAAGGEVLVYDPTAPSFRGVWADAFNSGFKSTTQINNLVSRAVTGRYNAVVVEVMAYHDRTGGGHGAYWNSAILPKATDITGGIDPLATLVTQAHNAGLQVHAWIVPMRACSAWPPSGNSLLASHPEWLMVPKASMGLGPAKVDNVYVLDPGSPDVQDYLVSIVRELVTNYAIDGINLDYIRYTTTDAGYPADESYAGSSLARFRALTGYVGTPNATGNAAWNDFRRRTITELVRRLRAEIPSVTSNPRQPVRLTADLICFGSAPASFENSDAYKLFQDWRYWLEQGYLDAGVPMNYKRDWVSGEYSMYRSWVNAAVAWRYNRHVYCGQANYLNAKSESITQMTYVLNSGANGTCNYSYVGTADENHDDNWETDWTWYSYVANNLHTYNVAVPTLPWRNAATATEGTIWGRVADPATDHAIDGALVQIDSRTVETDGAGYYVTTLLPAVPGGTGYTVIASKANCSTMSFPNIVVYPGQVTRLDVPLCNSAPSAGDMNNDGVINGSDLNLFVYCLRGPSYTYPPTNTCNRGDANKDQHVDMFDFANFQREFGN